MSSPSATNNTRRSTRIEDKKRKIEKSTSGNTSERNDNNGTTKPKKYKTDKNGNGQCQLHHDDGGQQRGAHLGGPQLPP